MRLSTAFFVLPFSALFLPCTSARAAAYVQNFTAPNGTTGMGLGDGSSINYGGGFTPSVQSNASQLTSVSIGSTTSGFIIPALADSSKGFF